MWCSVSKRRRPASGEFAVTRLRRAIWVFVVGWLRYDRTMQASELATLLDRTLNVADFQDASHNGLQVACVGKVRRVACGVDASMAFFADAARAGANFLICHHGISWGDSLKRITGLNHQRIEFLLRNDMALYACHLPLDAHPQLGNNAQICKALGLLQLKPFGLYHGQNIGFSGSLPRAMPYAAFRKRVIKAIGPHVRDMAFGAKTVRRVAVEVIWWRRPPQPGLMFS